MNKLNRMLVGTDFSECSRSALEQAVRLAKSNDAHLHAFEAMEKELVRCAIQLAQGSQAKAARRLKISSQTMHKELQRFGLKEPTDNDSGDSPPT
jgi:DNA-binding NtrC family response regulator